MKGEENKTISELLRSLICLSPVLRFRIPCCVCMCVSVSFIPIVSESNTHEKKKSKRIQHTELFALNVFYNLFIPLLMMQMAFQYFFFLDFLWHSLFFSLSIENVAICYFSYRFFLHTTIFAVVICYLCFFLYIFISCLT